MSYMKNTEWSPAAATERIRTLSPQNIPCVFYFIFIFNRFYLYIIYVFNNSLSLAGNSGRLTWVRQQPQKEKRYPFLAVCVAFSCVQKMVWLPVFGILTCTDVDAYNCTRGLYGHRKRVCIGSCLGEKSRATPGTRTRVSIALGFSVGRSTN